LITIWAGKSIGTNRIQVPLQQVYVRSIAEEFIIITTKKQMAKIERSIS